ALRSGVAGGKAGASSAGGATTRETEMTLRLIAVSACVLMLSGCRTIPPLPNVDARRFQGDVAKAIERATSGAKARPADPESTLAVCMVLHAHEQYQAASQ